MTEDQLEFAIFCIENLAERMGRPTPQVFDLLTKQSDLLYGYILPSYDVLHTQGKDYIVEDILSLLRQKGVCA